MSQPSRRPKAAPPAPAVLNEHDTIVEAIRTLLDASSKTSTDPAGARASVAAALRLLLPIVAPASQGPDDGGGTRLPGR